MKQNYPFVTPLMIFVQMCHTINRSWRNRNNDQNQWHNQQMMTSYAFISKCCTIPGLQTSTWIPITSTLKVQAIQPSITFISTNKTTQGQDPQDQNQNNRCPANLTTYMKDTIQYFLKVSSWMRQSWSKAKRQSCPSSHHEVKQWKEGYSSSYSQPWH
jgi:hypothetical protein